MKLKLTSSEIEVCIYLIEHYAMTYQDIASQLAKQRVIKPITNKETIEIDLPTYYAKMIFEDCDNYIETNQDEFDDCKEAKTLKNKLAKKLDKPKNIKLEEVESAMDHTKLCLNEMREVFVEYGEFDMDDVLEEWIYGCIRVMRKEV
jgi:hypothetical protein